MAATAACKAELYRMATPEHTCPWGLKALDLLKSREEVKDKDAITCKPVIALFGMALAMALAASGLPTTHCHGGRGRMVRRLRDVSAGAPEAEGRRGLRHHVPQLRPAGPALDPVRQDPLAEGLAGVLMAAGALMWHRYLWRCP